MINQHEIYLWPGKSWWNIDDDTARCENFTRSTECAADEIADIGSFALKRDRGRLQPRHINEIGGKPV